MLEMSRVVLEEGGKAYVSGLSWHPISQTSYGGRISEIRDLADRIDATKHIELKAADGLHAGLYTFDPDFSDEKRPSKVYSLAANLAHAYVEQNTIALWYIHPDRADSEVALVVIEGGAPTLDLVLPAHEVVDTLEAYNIADGVFQVVSNAPANVTAQVVVSTAKPSLLFDKAYALAGLPTNLVKAGIALAGVLFVVGALFSLNQYWEYQEAEEQAELARKRAQMAIQTPQYLQALDKAQTSIGLSTDSYSYIIDTLLEYPFAARGWQLDNVSCKKTACTAVWNSEGGYTDELISFLYNQTPKIDKKTAEKLAFEFEFASLPLTNLPQNADLPAKQVLSDQLYLEQQAWRKTGLTAQIDVLGAMWPSKFNNVPVEQVINRHELNISGSVALVQDFLTRYGQSIIWEELTFQVNPTESTNPLTLSMKGAFYAN